MNDFSVGERMGVYRRRAGLTKSELAERVDTSVSTISKYENDKVSDYDIDILIGISVNLGVSINKLLIGIEDPNKRTKLEGLIKSN